MLDEFTQIEIYCGSIQVIKVRSIFNLLYNHCKHVLKIYHKALAFNWNFNCTCTNCMVTTYNAKQSLDCKDEKYTCGINTHWLVSSSRNLYYRKSSFPLEIFAAILAFGMISVRLLPFLGTDGACLRFHLSHSSHILFLKDIFVSHCFESQHGWYLEHPSRFYCVFTMFDVLF